MQRIHVAQVFSGSPAWEKAEVGLLQIQSRILEMSSLLEMVGLVKDRIFWRGMSEINAGLRQMIGYPSPLRATILAP